MTERLVALETADIDVPAPPGVGFRPPLYFRVRSIAAGALRIELWELGKPHGARSVSSSGTKAFEARRISLAAAELARQLRKRRIAEIAALEETDDGDRSEAGGSVRIPLYARFVWTLGARSALVPRAETWLAGPKADVALAFDGGQRVSLGAAWLAGEAASEPARWLEVRLALAQSFQLGSDAALTGGLDAAAASARFGGARDGGVLPLHAMSGRASAFVHADFRLGSFLVLGMGPEVGVVLRPVTLERAAGTDRFGGLWLGVGLMLSIDPAGP